MSFEIVRNDITKMKVDAVVNTANPNPVIGVGTDAAIHAAAGPRLYKARQRIGVIAEGCCAATRAYDLDCRYVLHTVTPVWQGGGQGEERLLRAAYDAALREAIRLRCGSVAFPLLAAGNDGFPKERALSVAIQAFTDFLLLHELKIYLVVFDRDAYALAGSLFDGLKSFIDDNYAAAKQADNSVLPQASAMRPERKERRPAPPARTPREESCESPPPMQYARRPAEKFDAQAMLRPTAMPQAMPVQPKAGAIPKELHDLLENTDRSFAAHLISLLQECGEKDSAVYHRAQISRQLFHKILNKPGYVPSKQTVIQLAIGLRLDLPQTQRLLETAGYCLARNNKTDLVVQYYITRREYNLVLINVALDDCGLPPLKQA